jgi:hypothetical protein
MLKARHGKEMVVKVQNEIGLLANLTQVLAQKGVNILAVSAGVAGANAVVHLVTDDNLRAGDALRKQRYNPQERDVVLVDVPHKPGMLRHVTELLAKQGIDLHHLYGSAALPVPECLLVFASANNDRAVVVLNG